jgi:hypothetical protein
VYQIVRIMEQQFGDAQRLAAFPPPDEIVRRQHCNSPFPEIFRAREFGQYRRILRVQLSPNNVLGAKIHKIPVVDARSIGKVEFINGPSLARITPAVLFDQDQKRRKPFFMVRGS